LHSRVQNDHFSPRWTGKVFAPACGLHTLTATADDGVRLWINGQELVNDWKDHAARSRSGSLTLVGGQKYTVRMEYYEYRGLASAKLSWNLQGYSTHKVSRADLFSQ
jgi:hypothetical protein